MYERFFALTKAPFSISPDPSCVFLTAQHTEAIKELAWGVIDRKGYLLFTAEAGLGKTTVLRVLIELLAESDIVTCFMSAPRLTASEFLEMAMLNFGFKEIPASKAQRLKKLEEFLLKLDAEDRTAALIVDEAHQLSADLLEEIRLLGNLESPHRKLLQVVLAGQKDLEDKLNLAELWQLKQRITLRKSLRRLYPDAIAEYIRFRWVEAGGAEPLPFNIDAIEAVVHWSGGIPRVINVICDNALLVAFSESTRRIGMEVIREACHDLALPTPVFTRTLSSPTPEPISFASPSIDGTTSIAPQSQMPPDLASPIEEPVEEAEDAQEGEQVSAWKRWLDSRRQPSKTKTGILLLREP
jgi:general secretion pathway protein A